LAHGKLAAGGVYNREVGVAAEVRSEPAVEGGADAFMQHLGRRAGVGEVPGGEKIRQTI